MRTAAAAGLGFLFAVLWFDLMFDVQARGAARAALSAEVRASIVAYYGRVVVRARPMNRLVALTMLATLGALAGEIAQGDAPAWASWSSLALTAAAVTLAAARTVPTAARLGRDADDAPTQTALARSILRDHVFCALAIGAALVIQLAAA
jgi:hypothetical protein